MKKKKKTLSKVKILPDVLGRASSNIQPQAFDDSPIKSPKESAKSNQRLLNQSYQKESSIIDDSLLVDNKPLEIEPEVLKLWEKPTSLRKITEVNRSVEQTPLKQNGIGHAFSWVLKE